MWYETCTSISKNFFNEALFTCYNCIDDWLQENLNTNFRPISASIASESVSVAASQISHKLQVPVIFVLHWTHLSCVASSAKDQVNLATMPTTLTYHARQPNEASWLSVATVNIIYKDHPWKHCESSQDSRQINEQFFLWTKKCAKIPRCNSHQFILEWPILSMNGLRYCNPF